MNAAEIVGWSVDAEDYCADCAFDGNPIFAGDEAIGTRPKCAGCGSEIEMSLTTAEEA